VAWLRFACSSSRKTVAVAHEEDDAGEVPVTVRRVVAVTLREGPW
jgi:hypothetical protein